MTTNAELLLSRVVDRCADGDDWQALHALAATDPALWKRLAEGLEDDDALRAGLGPQLDVAERVEAPVVGRPAPRFRPADGLRWSGWAAALLLAALWWRADDAALVTPGRPGSFDEPLGSPFDRPFGRPFDRPLDPPFDAPFDAPFDPSVVDSAPFEPAPDVALPVIHRPAAADVQELPKLLLGTRPAADGQGLDVFYLRRSLERRTVTGAYQLAEDELGNLRPVPVDLASLSVSDVL